MENIWRCLFFFLFHITLFKKTYCESNVDVDHVNAKIFNGNVVDIENFGYHLQILIEGKFRCGASLISRSWALTAAQCTDGKTSEALSLFGGSRNFKEGTKIPIKGIVQHPNYDLRTKVDDIALLNFDLISFTKTLYPIALPKTGQAFVEGTKCNISGFGLDENFRLPAILLAAEITISDQDICIQNYVDKGVTVVNSTMICAGTKDFKDTCSGDEGGPLVCDQVLTGITSFGIGCSFTEFPGVSTRVSSYINWITWETTVNFLHSVVCDGKRFNDLITKIDSI